MIPGSEEPVELADSTRQEKAHRIRVPFVESEIEVKKT